MKSFIERLLNASIATKFIGVTTSIFLIAIAFASVSIRSMQKKSAVREAHLFADSTEKMALSGLTTLMITGQMEHREQLLSQINETGIVSDLRIISGPKVIAAYGAGRESEKAKNEYENAVIRTGVIHTENENDEYLRIVKPIHAQANYLGKNCLACHQVKPNEVLGAITMRVSLVEITKQSRRLSLEIAGVGLVVVAILIIGILLVSRFIISTPLEQVLLSFQRLQQKDYTIKINPRYRDEIGRVGDGVNTFIEYSVELLTKLGKISHQLSSLANKTRETAENFLRLSERQANVIEETSQAVEDLNTSLSTEKDELKDFHSLVRRTVEYAVAWGDMYHKLSGKTASFRDAYEENTHDFKVVYKNLNDAIGNAETIFDEKIKEGQNNNLTEIKTLQKLIADLSGVAVLLKRTLLMHIKASDSYMQTRNQLDEFAQSIDENEKDIGKLTTLHDQIVEEAEAQNSASGEISKTISILSTEASSTAATAMDLTQMAHEASRLALLLKDLLDEFNLPQL
ncbi:MAG TPA: methyl-accepting chemotaxis protein [Turneriella sp.]|nr:methyl-accepting chemotaxis protein [Turneriella sp.]